MRVPDEDMPEWIKTLREGGFNDEEMDLVFTRLNRAYREAKYPDAKKEEYIEKELEELKKYFLQKYSRVLTPTEIEYLKKGIESRFEEE